MKAYASVKLSSLIVDFPLRHALAKDDVNLLFYSGVHSLKKKQPCGKNIHESSS